MVPLCWPTFVPHSREPWPHRSPLLSGSRGWVAGTQPQLRAQVGHTIVLISRTFAREGSGGSRMEALWGCRRWPHSTPAPPEHMAWPGMTLRWKSCYVWCKACVDMPDSPESADRSWFEEHPYQNPMQSEGSLAAAPQEPHSATNTQVSGSIPASPGPCACLLNTTLLWR